MKSLGFIHRQGSGYISEKPMTISKLSARIIKMHRELPWLIECEKHFDATVVGENYDMIKMVKSFTNKTKSNKIDMEQCIKKNNEKSTTSNKESSKFNIEGLNSIINSVQNGTNERENDEK